MFRWEFVFFEPEVSLNIHAVRIAQSASVEVKIRSLCILLNNLRNLRENLICLSDERLLSVELRNLFDDSDEEARRVLMVWHDSEAGWQLLEHLCIVMVHKHGLSGVTVQFSWHILELNKLIEEGVLFAFRLKLRL